MPRDAEGLGNRAPLGGGAANSEHPDFAGMWFYVEDGAEWASAEALREEADAAEDAPEEDAA